MLDDFIGFTYNNIHSSELGIYRTSNGGRYDDNVTAAMNDKVAEVPGGDGQYYFGTTFTNRTFAVSFAFDNLTEEKIRLIKETFSGDGVHDLIFDEAPYKVWSAKVTGSATMKHLCFEEGGRRIYKGEGNITFTCYYPYAHTPNLTKSGGDGRFLSNYLDIDYPNKSEWAFNEDGTTVLPLMLDNSKQLQNLGDLPAPFIFRTLNSVEAGTTFQIGDCFIKTQKDCEGLEWDSRTGLVTTYEEDVLKVVPCLGLPTGALPCGENKGLKRSSNTELGGCRSRLTRTALGNIMYSITDGERVTLTLNGKGTTAGYMKTIIIKSSCIGKFNWEVRVNNITDDPILSGQRNMAIPTDNIVIDFPQGENDAKYDINDTFYITIYAQGDSNNSYPTFKYYHANLLQDKHFEEPTFTGDGNIGCEVSFIIKNAIDFQYWYR